MSLLWIFIFILVCIFLTKYYNTTYQQDIQKLNGLNILYKKDKLIKKIQLNLIKIQQNNYQI